MRGPSTPPPQLPARHGCKNPRLAIGLGRSNAAHNALDQSAAESRVSTTRLVQHAARQSSEGTSCCYNSSQGEMAAQDAGARDALPNSLVSQPPRVHPQSEREVREEKERELRQQPLWMQPVQP